MDYFERLGVALEDAWSERNREEERFPAAALEVLARMPPQQAWGRAALLDHLLDPHRPVPLQLAPLGAFGQPGFTVLHGHGFVVEVYHWLESLSAIHDHPFCGAFTILDGFSVHARYEATPGVRLGGRARRVELRLAALELLTVGAVVPFSLQSHPLVHALVHVPSSSISMVVRTVRTEGYSRYLPPTVALPMEGEAEPLGRQLALLDALATAGDPSHQERLARLLARADFELALRALSAEWPRRTPVERGALLELVRPRLGEAAELLPPVLDHALRLQHATALRESLRDPDLRLVAVALGYAERRDQVLELLRARGVDPLACLHRFVDEAGMFGAGEEASVVIGHVLVEGGGPERALAELRAAYGAEAIAAHEADVRSFCETSLLAVLREDPRSTSAAS